MKHRQFINPVPVARHVHVTSAPPDEGEEDG